jgi:hypothetical protein
MAAADRSGEGQWARPAVYIEADFEPRILQSENAIVPVAGFRAGDKFDVDFVWLGFDIDVEDSLVRTLGRFGPKTVAIDEDLRGGQRGGRYRGAVDFQTSEGPRAFERAELVDVAGQVRPRAEATFSSNCGLDISEPKTRGLNLVERHVASGGQVFLQRGDRLYVAGLDFGEERFCLAAKMIEIGAGWELLLHDSSP